MPPFDAAVLPISVRVLCAPDVARMDGWMPRGGASAAMTTLDGVLRCARWIMTTQDYVGARITSSLCPLVRVKWRRLRPPAAAAAVAWNTRPPSSPGMAPDDRRRPSRGERRGASCMCVCACVQSTSGLLVASHRGPACVSFLGLRVTPGPRASIWPAGPQRAYFSV